MIINETPLELPVCTINFEEYKVSIYQDQLKREIGWLSQFEQEKQPWSSFHSKSSSELVPGKHSLMPLINEKVNTKSKIPHCEHNQEND